VCARAHFTEMVGPYTAFAIAFAVNSVVNGVPSTMLQLRFKQNLQFFREFKSVAALEPVVIY